MATLYAVDRPPLVFSPGARAFTLGELQLLVGGYIEALYPAPGQVLFINEDGKRLGLPVNRRATALMRGRLLPGDVIVGAAVLCSFEEAGQR